jgi:hypothetical protein
VASGSYCRGDTRGFSQQRKRGQIQKKVFVCPESDDQVTKTQAGQGSLSPDRDLRFGNSWAIPSNGLPRISLCFMPHLQAADRHIKASFIRDTVVKVSSLCLTSSASSVVKSPSLENNLLRFSYLDEHSTQKQALQVFAELKNTHITAIFLNGRYVTRTRDPFRVKEVRYHCANRP